MNALIALGKQLIPFARRRPVPWEGGDVLLLFLLCTIILPGATMLAMRGLLGTDAGQPASDKPSMAHPAEQMLATKNAGMIALAAFMAVVVAPLIEELLFRVVLQGWLEAAWSRQRRIYPALRRGSRAWGPLVLPALVFALMHLRAAKGQPPTEYLPP